MGFTLMNFKPIKGEYNSFEQLLSWLKTMPRKQSTILVGIDGCGGSGKSTIASKVKGNNSDITIVHMDDFYRPSSEIIKDQPTIKPVGADFNWQRLLNQVIEPLTQDKEGFYQRYDWETDSLAEWYTISFGGIVVIEGVYSIRKELADKYDFKIWVDCPREIRLSRGLERDGENARDLWVNNWMISEDIYVEEHKPFERADLIINGTI
jgi:uridine kinase